jgi:hypothetical protein
MALVKVEHTWDDSKGRCYDCGDPALYCVPDAYGPNHKLNEANLRCPVCAALIAAEDGERLVHLFPEDYDSIDNKEIAAHYPIKE